MESIALTTSEAELVQRMVELVKRTMGWWTPGFERRERLVLHVLDEVGRGWTAEAPAEHEVEAAQITAAGSACAMDRRWCRWSCAPPLMASWP